MLLPTIDFCWLVNTINTYPKVIISSYQFIDWNVWYRFLLFLQACKRAESSKSCNLIGSGGGRYFTILPANPSGIVGRFIHKFVCCLRMSKNRHFETIFLLKLAILVALAREKWELLFSQKIWRENQASQLGKPLQ